MQDRPSVCPWCLTTTDFFTPLTAEVPPEDGDVSICPQCGMPAIIEAEAIGGLRRPTDDEHQELGADPRVLQVMADWLRANHPEVFDEPEL